MIDLIHQECYRKEFVESGVNVLVTDSLTHEKMLPKTSAACRGRRQAGPVRVYHGLGPPRIMSTMP